MLLRILAVALTLPLAAQEVDYLTQIKPLFAARCYECHGEKEQEADLRLDRRSAVFHAKEADWVIKPGNAKDSSVVQRIKLPKDDIDIMPAEGEPLTADEISLISRWIDQGAKWPEDGADEAPAAPKKPLIEIIEVTLTDAQASAAKEAVATLQTRGAVAGPIAREQAALDVNLSLVRPVAGDADLTAVGQLGPALVWLNLSRSAVTDAGLAQHARCTSLRRLHLAQTDTGDAGLAHLAGLANLRFLNLFGTKVTDQGLNHLHGLAQLEKIFLWQSSVTDAGVAALQKALPQLVVDRGGYADQVLKVAADLAAAEAKEKAAVAGKAANTKCPVSGEPIDPEFSVVFEDRTVAFCCTKCKAKFEAEPSKFAPNLPPKKD